MYSFIPKVEEILEANHICVFEQIATEHITINTDELMRDSGFAEDRKVLDLFIDEENKILFIGLLRIPKNARRKKIGTGIVQQLIDWSEQQGYTVFLDSCGDSFAFWTKCGFELIEHRYGFDIMGFGDDVKEKWKMGKRIFFEIH